MMRFTINSKEFKTMLEKGITAINKKAVMPNLQRIYFRMEDDTLKVLGTDFDQYIEVRTEHIYNCFNDNNSDVFGIDADDIKIITKMNGVEITLEEEEDTINLKCGKRVISIKKYNNDVLSLPVMYAEEHILTVKESWLLETVTNLVTFTSKNEVSKMMQVFHFNTMENRVETLDGYRIGIRSLEGQKIEKESSSLFDDVLLKNMCVPVFKKVMDKKSMADVKIFQDKKYVRVEGRDFTYIHRRQEGEYYKIDKMLVEDSNYMFAPDRENMIDVMKYNCDLLVKDDKKPIILHSENGCLYSFFKNSRCEVLDEIDVKGNSMSEDLFIGFDPRYIMDVFNIVDAEYPECSGVNERSPMLIKGDEYSFVVLSVHLRCEESRIDEIIVEKIKKDKAA